MNREQWPAAERVLTRVMSLPAEQQEHVIAEELLDDAFRRQILEVLRRTRSVAPNVTAAVAAAGTSGSPGVLRSPASPAGSGSGTAAAILKANETVAAGRYHVIRQLGRGGMGEVYLATDTTFGSLVALKVLLTGDTREAQHARQCSGHPNIVTMYDVFPETIGGRDVTVLVMEHVAGRSADLIIDDGEVPLADAVRWARQTASALAHAHDSNVLHCDLKPANIIVTADGVKVVDFGIGRATFDHALPGAPLRGTLPYMAPELLSGGDCGRASDIYSLGVTLFQLLTGRLPFEAAGMPLILQIVGAPPPRIRELRKDVPADLEAVVSTALAKEPDERYRSARAFERALEAVEERLRTASRPRTRTWRVAAAGIGGAAAVLSGMTAIGALTSVAFNTMVGRSAFVDEGLGTWFYWGWKAGLPPFLIVMAILLAAALGWLVWTLLRMLSPRVRDVSEAVLRQVRGVLDADWRTLVAAALLVSAVAAAGAGWAFRDLFPAFVVHAADGDPERLGRLSEVFVTRHNAFRGAFTALTVLVLLVWYPVLRQVQLRQAPLAASMPAVLVVVAVVFFLQLPYRAMYGRLMGEVFEVVQWQGTSCQIIGRSDTQFLLICPELPTARHRVVAADAEGLVRSDVRETVFLRFYKVAASQPRPHSSR